MTWEPSEGVGTWKTRRFPAPTLQELKRHFDRYGLDKMKGGFRRESFVDKTYKTWARAREDSLLEVAEFFLEDDELLDLLAHVGLSDKVIAQAKEALNGEDDIRESGGRSQRGRVLGPDGAKQPAVSTEGARRRDSRSRSARSR